MAAIGGTMLPGFAMAGTTMPIYPPGVSTFEDVPIKELLMAAIGAAKTAGASFSDARIGRYQEAIADFTAAIKVDPQNAPALTNRALALSELKRPDAALKAARLRP